MDPSLTQIPSVTPTRQRDFRRSNKRIKPRFTLFFAQWWSQSMASRPTRWPTSSKDLYTVNHSVHYSIELQSIHSFEKTERRIPRSMQPATSVWRAFIGRTIISFFQKKRKAVVEERRWKKEEGREKTEDGTHEMEPRSEKGEERRRWRRRRVASLAAVVFQGMLGGRFPRGLCYRLGRMTSPRYQILNLLAPAAYPRQGIQTFPPTDRDPSAYPPPPLSTGHHRCLPSKPTA